MRESGFLSLSFVACRVCEFVIQPDRFDPRTQLTECLVLIQHNSRVVWVAETTKQSGIGNPRIIKDQASIIRVRRKLSTEDQDTRFQYNYDHNFSKPANTKNRRLVAVGALYMYTVHKLYQTLLD